MSVNKCVLILPLFFAIGKFFNVFVNFDSTCSSPVENEAPSFSSIQTEVDVQGVPTVLHSGLWNILGLRVRANRIIMGSGFLACLVQLIWVPTILERP